MYILEKIKKSGVVPPPTLQYSVLNAFNRIPSLDPTWPLWMFLGFTSDDSGFENDQKVKYLFLETPEEAEDRERKRKENMEVKQLLSAKKKPDQTQRRETIKQIKQRERKRNEFLQLIQATDKENFLKIPQKEPEISEDDDIDDVVTDPEDRN